MTLPQVERLDLMELTPDEMKLVLQDLAVSVPVQMARILDTITDQRIKDFG